MKEINLIANHLPLLEELLLGIYSINLEDATGISAKDQKTIQQMLPRCILRFL